MNRRATLIVLTAVLAAATIAPLSLRASGIDFPGGLPSSLLSDSTAQMSRQQVEFDGRTVAIHAVSSDPEQTLIGYSVTGKAGDGDFVSIGAMPRLVLSDGTLIGFVGNSVGTNGATLVFAGIPSGVQAATLQIDGLAFANARIDRQFTIALRIDNRNAWSRSARVDVLVTGGVGSGQISVTSVSRTPSLVVIRGRFDGLSEDEIKAIGRPEVSLVSDQARVASESGRLGFGEGYRDFEMRFPAVGPGQWHLELSGFGAETLRLAEATLLPITVP